jgi:Ser/Thr protein kinase RdoA (MazF antagonist)
MFPQPENIINNYRIVSQYLKYQTDSLQVPEMVLTNSGKLFWIDEDGNFWRGTVFINNSYTPSSLSNEKEAFLVANSFGRFTLALAGLDTEKLDTIIPDFHNLSFRYQQFETAIQKATIQRLLKSTHVIAELRQRKFLVDFYQKIRSGDDFKQRVMHHDCKISNILFDKTTKQVICPVDLDTTMPGYYFSDLGDMLRAMACTVDENSTRWEDIDVERKYYNAIVSGYVEIMKEAFTAEEEKHIHHSGVLLTYMQALRFVTDFLNNDIYYKTNYPEQNLNRALNQLILLEKIEEFLRVEYKYSFS